MIRKQTEWQMCKMRNWKWEKLMSVQIPKNRFMEQMRCEIALGGRDDLERLRNNKITVSSGGIAERGGKEEKMSKL
jgi:hypothetical protein